jgi:hypothetical protein
VDLLWLVAPNRAVAARITTTIWIKIGSLISYYQAIVVASSQVFPHLPFSFAVDSEFAH